MIPSPTLAPRLRRLRVGFASIVPMPRRHRERGALGLLGQSEPCIEAGGAGA
jgi:hypothetical protein